MLREYYNHHWSNMPMTKYGRLLFSFKSDEDVFFVVRPTNEKEYTEIVNLNNRQSKQQSVDDVLNTDYLNSSSSNWQQEVFFLTTKTSPIYRDVFSKLPHNELTTKDIVEGISKKTDHFLMKKAGIYNIIERKNKSIFYQKIFDDSIQSFSYKNRAIEKQSLKIDDYVLKHLGSYSRIHLNHLS